MDSQIPARHHRIQLESPSIENHLTTPSILLTLVTLAVCTHYLLSRVDRSVPPWLSSCWNLFVRAMPPPLAHWARAGPGRFANGAMGTVFSPLQHIDRLSGNFGQETKNDIVARGKRIHPNSPKGLGNWDNSCYQNSVLQGLAAVPAVQTFLENVEQRLRSISDGLTTSSLRSLIQELNDTNSDCSYLWTPRMLKSMSTWQQQDAQEYFSKLMDAIEKEVKTGCTPNRQDSVADLGLLASSNPSVGDIVLKGHDTVDTSSDADGERIYSKVSAQRNPLHNPLEGLLAQRVGCVECGFTEGLSLIPFNCMTLPLGRSSECRIEDCLEEFTNLEYIEGVECPKCSLLGFQSQLIALLDTIETDPERHDEEAERSSLERKRLISVRLAAIDQALEVKDFSESTLKDQCQIPSRLRKHSTKSRQAALLRTPRCLIMHINRSLFDEYTGAQLKNYAAVDFPESFDPLPWVVGGDPSCQDNSAENASLNLSMDPRESMLPTVGADVSLGRSEYVLKALIIHYGRHENGHYICYRQSPHMIEEKSSGTETGLDETKTREQWWRISDEDVTEVSLEHVLSQPGAFMLFYERRDNLGKVSETENFEPEQHCIQTAPATAPDAVSQIGAQSVEVNESASDEKVPSDPPQTLYPPQTNIDRESQGGFIHSGATAEKHALISSTNMRSAVAPQESSSEELPLNPSLIVASS